MDTQQNEDTKNTNTTDGLEEKLAQCESQKDEYLAGWQRTKADFINYKRDEVMRLQEVARYSSEQLLGELIAVLDSFDLGLAALEQKGPVEKGIYMIRIQIADTLKKHGLTQIPVKTGDMFDPAIAEAIAEGESDLPEGSIIQEIEPGYRLHNKVLRPARVKIATHRQAQEKGQK